MGSYNNKNEITFNTLSYYKSQDDLRIKNIQKETKNNLQKQIVIYYLLLIFSKGKENKHSLKNVLGTIYDVIRDGFKSHFSIIIQQVQVFYLQSNRIVLTKYPHEINFDFNINSPSKILIETYNTLLKKISTNINKLELLPDLINTLQKFDT